MTSETKIACTNCCGAGYFGLDTDCRVCGGTGRVIGCGHEKGGRVCQLKAGHKTAHACWSTGMHVSWRGDAT